MKRFLITLLYFCLFIIGFAQDVESLANDSVSYQDADISEQIINSVTQMLANSNGDMEETKAAVISLMIMADSFADLHDYKRAIKLGTQAAEIHKRKLGDNGPDYATALDKLAVYYYHLCNYPKAVELGTQAAEIFKRELGENDSTYVNSIDNLADYYYHLGDNNKAFELGMQELEIYKHKFGEDNLDYADLINRLAVFCHYNLGDESKAIELGTQAAEIRKRVLGQESTDYATSLNNLAVCYSHSGNNIKAIELGTQAAEIRKRVLGENHYDYATSLKDLAWYYLYSGDYNKAIELGTQAAEFFKRESGANTIIYVSLLEILSICYSYLCNYPKAVELGTQAAEFFKRELGENDSNYVNSLDNLSGYYSHLGDYNKAIELGMKTLEIYKREFGENTSEYATSLNNMAVYYTYYGDYAKAIELGRQALVIRKRELGENSHEYAASLNVLEGCYSNLGDYNKAIELGMKALEIYKRELGENTSEYATSLNNMAGDYFFCGNYNKAIELGTQAADVFKRKLGENHPNYAASLENISFFYLLNSDYLMAITTLRDAIGIEHAFLSQTLSYLPSTYQSTFWHKYQKQFQNIYPYLSYLYQTNQQLSDCYDKSCLFAKGLLLSAETDMRKLILESGNVEAVKKFEQLQTTRAWLNKLYEKPIAERHVSTDSLENVAEKLEMELVHMSKTYGDFMHNLKLTWKDVQDKLSDKDVAVEFLSFPVLNSDSTMYIALTVRKGYDAPHMVTLFEENELKSIKSSYYESSELSKLVWGKMADELEGVENIYFSPSGELYNIAIESMPHWSNSGMMGDRFNLYRLSSTRELAINRSKTKSSGAVVYGGIVYKTDVANMGTPRTDKEYLYTYCGFDPDSTNCRGTNWKYLYGTLLEANDIVAILKNNNIPVDSLTGIDATEASLKDLSGQKKRILHISTHGFYWSESAAESKYERDKLRFLQMGDDRPRYIEDKAMTRSGLLFAGAQNTFDGVEIPASVEDGVLTAQEISNLDLRGLDLLTLSACQTGLGEIKGDGVFGLQRGFKKAGACSILMSLWKVDDLSSRLFMTQFYRNYISGKSKQKSFKLAQKFIREYKDENGVLLFNDPSYWTAFILLDALD